jgi:hypothetical protein
MSGAFDGLRSTSNQRNMGFTNTVLFGFEYITFAGDLTHNAITTS